MSLSKSRSSQIWGSGCPLLLLAWVCQRSQDLRLDRLRSRRFQFQLLEAAAHRIGSSELQ